MKENRELVKIILDQLSRCSLGQSVSAKIGESLLIVAEDLDDPDSATQRIFTQLAGVDKNFMLGLTTGLAFAVENVNVARQIKESQKELAKEKGEEYVQ